MENISPKHQTLETLKLELEKLEDGNPPAENAGLFGTSISPDLAQLVIIAAPCDLTASYGKGTKYTPNSIVEPSHQLDLLDLKFGLPFQAGIALDDTISQYIIDIESSGADLARNIVTAFEKNLEPADADLKAVNELTTRIHKKIEDRADYHLREGKHIAVLGGDHSVSLGALKALGKIKRDWGILHIDAHHDLRKAYEGFTHSHASIMYNAIEEIPTISKLVSIGIRDFCQFEYNYATGNPKIETLYDTARFEALAAGKSYKEIYAPILEALPNEVYISLDIDGLDPALCPHTGTPVPGGLSYNEAIWLIEKLVESGRKIVGFDLCEVSKGDDDWDLNVGARVLYKLCGALVKSCKIDKIWNVK